MFMVESWWPLREQLVTRNKWAPSPISHSSSSCSYMLNTENRHQDSHAEESSEGEIVALLLGKWAIGPNSPSWGEKVSICTRQGEAVVGDGPDELDGDSRDGPQTRPAMQRLEHTYTKQLFVACMKLKKNSAVFGILVQQTGSEPMPLAAEAWSPNHWITRGFPKVQSFLTLCFNLSIICIYVF